MLPGEVFEIDIGDFGNDGAVCVAAAIEVTDDRVGPAVPAGTSVGFDAENDLSTITHERSLLLPSARYTTGTVSAPSPIPTPHP